MPRKVGGANGQMGLPASSIWRMTRRIVLLGATGYTGARTAAAMTARGLTPVLAGRNPAKLDPLARRLRLSTATVDVADPDSVRALVGAQDVLVSTVGPFSRLGEPAVAAAAAAGAIYVDSTGEAPFIRRVFEEFGPRASRRGAALLTAFGNDYVPGNLAGALALRQAGERAHRVHIGYFMTGTGGGQAFSRGTLDSLLENLLEPGYTWHDDALRTESLGARVRSFEVAGRMRLALSIGASEHFALPRLAPGLREVGVYFGGGPGPATRAVHLFSRVVPVLARLPGARQVVSSIAGLATRGVSTEPDPVALADAKSYFVAEVSDAAGASVATVRLKAPDGYAITADLLAWAAGYAAEHGVARVGALGPVEAFGLDTLVAGAAEAGIVIM